MPAVRSSRRAPTSSPTATTRRPAIRSRKRAAPHMEEIFTTLAAAGVPRNNLYLAWDFTVASQRSLTERLLFMRDDAFTRLGSAARRPSPSPTSRTISIAASSAASPVPSRSSATSTATTAAGAVRARSRRPAAAPGDAADGEFHLHHPARRAGRRGMSTAVAGARVDLRPRPARLRTPRSHRATSRHGERAQLRLLRHELDRYVERGHRRPR